MNNIYNAIQNLYNMDKTTWQEVLAELYNLVSKIENKFDLFEVKFGSLLGEQVTRELKKMYDDGSLASLINDMLLKDINKKVDTFKIEVNEQLDNNTKYQDFKSGQSPKEFGAIPLHENSKFDSSDIIQGIIDTLATREFGGILVIDDVYGVSKPIYLKEKVQIQGKTSISFFNGMRYYSDTPTNVYSPRLKAINTIDDAVLIIENNDGMRKHVSRSISNFVIDGNKLAKHCLKLVGQTSNRQEDNTLIENIACQGATSHGVYAKETLTNKLINLNVSACNGYGIYLAYGFCDSVLINPYIHTNQGGGIYIGDGCSYLNITGGKIEDNYALGIKGYKCNKIYINGTQFHANNDKHILVDGENSKINATNCVLANADKSTIENKKTVQVINNGTITLRGCEISGTDYLGEATSGGTINLFNNDINVTKSMVKNRSSLNLNEVDNIVNGKLQRYNQGSELKKISIEPSSRGSVIFENLFDFSRYGTPYACLASYNLTIITTQYAQNGASKIFKGILSVGKSNTTYGANIITLTESNDTAWISSVGCELTNDNKDIKITINTGTNVGATSGFKDFYIYLEDIGHNSFSSLT